MDTFGNRLKAALKEAGYTQIKATQELDLSQNSLSNYISKNRIPETKILYKISLLLGVSMEWLLSGNPDQKYLSGLPPQEKQSGMIVTSQEEIDMLTLYRQLSDQNKIKIQGMLEIKASEEASQKQKSSFSQDSNESIMLA